MFISFSRTKKPVFMAEKWHYFPIHIPWHGISSKNLEMFEHGAKWNALMVRPDQDRSGLVMSGQVRSGQAMQSYLDPKVHIQHSACHTEATYQMSSQSGHRAQSNYSRYKNRLRALKHFRYLHIKAGVSKTFKVPAILSGTLHGDALSRVCAKYCSFSSWQKYLIMHFLLWHWKVKGNSEVMMLAWLKYWWLDSCCRFGRLNA